MWNYRQNINVDTSIKISPQCRQWPSVCWFTLKGVETWKYMMGNLDPTYQWALSILLLGLGLWTVVSVTRKWRKRDMIMVAMQDSLAENAVPQPETLGTEEQMVEDPLVTEISLEVTPGSTDTFDQDEFQSRPRKPINVKSKTMDSDIRKETKIRQTRNSVIPVFKKGVCIASKDQPQTSQKAGPSRRLPSSLRPGPRLMGSIPRDSTQNSGGSRFARQTDFRSRFNIPETPMWKL